MAMKPAGGTRHTPAPWRKEMGEINATIDESDYLIADASGDNDLSFDEAQANAELIADAPELLRLLQVAYRALRSYQNGYLSTGLAKEVADEIQPVLTRHGSAILSS
jgi:hypothetical protein